MAGTGMRAILVMTAMAAMLAGAPARADDAAEHRLENDARDAEARIETIDRRLKFQDQKPAGLKRRDRADAGRQGLGGEALDGRLELERTTLEFQQRQAERGAGSAAEGTSSRALLGRSGQR